MKNKDFNPHQPANTASAIAQNKKKKILWKLFSSIYAIWFLLYLYLLFTRQPTTIEFVGGNKIFEIPLHFYFVIGVFAFSYNFRVLAAIFWKISFPIAFLLECWVTISSLVAFEKSVTFIGGSELGRQLARFLPVLFVVIFWFFVFLAIYKYGNKSSEIWNTN